MEEGGERERNRVRGRERSFCCNVMLNSNMQCSHHGNGGSSEALHGAESVCLLASLFVSMRLHLCGIICRVSPTGGAVQRERMFKVA